ncbi:MAG: TonB-dependent receptor [Burkholderiales bacterium]|nr:TonB-dependent receptor [Burkholderiales bacterium]
MKSKTLLSCTLALSAMTMMVQSAVAQQAQQSQPKVEKIEVTGSNIKRIDGETIVPVTVITRDDIERSGKSTVSEFLRDIPQNGGASFNDTFTNSFSPGAAGISLRGLGQKSTLVLINGRRTSGYGFAQNIFDTYVDLNSIPASAVERIEVLRDGASAVYGSDAIAGVVNIIMRRDYRGLEVGASAGTSTEGGLDERRANLGFGIGDLSANGYNLLGTLDYYKRDQLLTSERKLLASQDFRNEIGGTLAWATRGAYLFPSATARTPFSNCAPGTVLPASQLSAVLTGDTCAYNPAAYTPLFPESERLGAILRGTAEFSKTLQGFFEFNYSKNETFQTSTIPQVSTSNLAFNPTTGGLTVIPGTLPANHPSNPFGRPVNFIYTMFELGPRNSTIESEAKRSLVGLKGVVGSWDWEFGTGVAQTDTVQVGINNLRTSVVRQALAGGYDFTGRTTSAIRPEQFAVDTVRTAESKLKFADVKASAEIVQLPAGALGVAIGAEWRKESLFDTPNAELAQGEVLGRGFTRTRGERTSTAGFLEFSVPILKNLETQLAVRQDRYSDVGSARSPKFGFRWVPADTLLIRGSTGRGFRAPTLPEASESNALSFITIRDPNFNNAQFSVGRLSVSNPDLKPEKSRSYNLGFVFEPVKDLAFSIDYYKIRQNNLIARDNPQLIINQAALGDPMWVAFVSRDPTTGFISFVRNPVRNREFIKTAGYDIEFKKIFRTPNYGNFTLSTAWNWLLEISTPASAGGVGINVADSNGLTGSNPRYKGNASIAWNKGPWSSTITYRYIHSFDQTAATGQARVGHYKDIDLFGAYQGFKNLKLTLSIRNLLDTDRPWDSSSTSGLDFSQYDMRGRYVTVGANYQFK